MEIPLEDHKNFNWPLGLFVVSSMFPVLVETDDSRYNDEKIKKRAVRTFLAYFVT